MNDCSCNGTLLSWVAGNDVLLLARVYEKVLNDGEVTDLPFDLSACDDIEVTAVGFRAETLEWAIAEDESNCLAVNIPHTLTVGEWAVEITCKRNGYHVRSFEFTFKIVETNCEAQTTFEVVDGCQSASVRVTLQVAPQAFVRGQNSYEAWKELPGNEDKTLQEYIDEALDLNAITAAAREATDAANNAAASAASTESDIETSEAARVLAEQGRVANENTRTVNEEAREGREVVRENNETGRVQAESTRVQSEFNRVQAERGRVASETNREEAEAQRESDCEAAVSAANAAATGAEKVNAVLSGNTLTVTNRNGVSTTTNVKGNPGVGVPVGGSTGQVLAKKSGSDYDTEWVNQSGGGGGYEPPVGGIPKTDLASDVQTSLGKADTALQSFTETDPTVPSWAKQSSKPSYSYSEITNTPTDLAHIGDSQGSATIANFDPLTDTVHIAAQTLSSSAQAQVRTNIGAQATLVSGTNIKTINNESILGSGNITIQGGGGGEANVIESISINGTTQTVTSKNVDLPVPVSSVVEQIVSISQSAYDALSTKDSATLYLITS